MRIVFHVDDIQHSLDLPSAKPLASILRDDLGFQSPPEGCSTGSCGHCLVLVNKQPVHACLFPAFKLRGTRVLTAEGLKKSPRYREIIHSMEESSFNPCQDCRSSRILLLHSLISRYGKLTEQQIQESYNIIRCSCSSFRAYSRAANTLSRTRRIRERARRS